MCAWSEAYRDFYYCVLGIVKEMKELLHLILENVPVANWSPIYKMIVICYVLIIAVYLTCVEVKKI